MEKQALAVRKQQWYQTITTAKQSGQSIKSWCAENGVPLSSFYSWQRKMRAALLQQTEDVPFEELSPSSPKTAAIPPTQITLHIRDVTVELPADLPKVSFHCFTEQYVLKPEFAASAKQFLH